MNIGAINFLNNKPINNNALGKAKINFKGQTEEDSFVKSQEARKPFNLLTASEDEIMRFATDVLVDSMNEEADKLYGEIPKDELDKIPLFSQIKPSDFVEIIENDSYEGEKAQAQYIRKEKYGRLIEIFNKINSSTNYKIMKALQAGAEKNPQKATEALSNTPHQIFTLTFNKDGSIKSINYKDPYYNTSVSIIPDNKGSVLAISETSHFYSVREFKMQDDGSYDLTRFEAIQK